MASTAGAAADKENVAPVGGAALRSSRLKGLAAAAPVVVGNVVHGEDPAGAVIKKPAATAAAVVREIRRGPIRCFFHP